MNTQLVVDASVKPAAPQPVMLGNVLFLSQYFWPEENATSEMLSGVAFELVGRGIPVLAVAGQPAYHRGSKKLPSVLEKEGVLVRRVGSTRFDKNHTLGRILNTATFTLSCFVSILRQPRPAALLAVTNPPLLLWIARGIGGVYRRPVILLIHDVYPQIASALGQVPETSLLSRSWRRLNKWAYRGAARIIVLDQAMAGVIQAELPPNLGRKVVVIPNWSDGNFIRPNSRRDHPLRKELGLADDFVLLYSGNIGLFHEIETIVRAAVRLREVNKIRFVFIGNGGQLPWLRDMVQNNELKNVVLLPFQAKERLPQTLSMCDAGFVTLKTAATGFCSPSKLYGLLAAGKPILALTDARAEAARVARTHQCGIHVVPGDDGHLAREILRLKDDPFLLETMGVRARRAFEENYTLPHVVNQYEDLLHEVFEETSK